MNKLTRFAPEVRERAIRLLLEQEGEYPSRWKAIQSLAAKIGCSPETLRHWARQAEGNAGPGADPPDDPAQRLRVLERENKELRRANEILKKASAYFAQAELDRRGP